MISSIPTTNRNLSLSKLLIQFNHPAAQVRKDALDGMKELTRMGLPNEADEQSNRNHSPQYVSLYIKRNLQSFIIKPAMSLLLDNEASVRKSLIQYYQLVLKWTILHEDEQESFRSMNKAKFDIIKPYLPTLLQLIAVGLTHVSDGIVLSSLELYECLLGKDEFVKHVANLSSGILNCLIGLLAKQKIGSSQTQARAWLNHDKKAQKPESSTLKLTGNPKSKIGTLENRMRILEALLILLSHYTLDRNFSNQKSYQKVINWNQERLNWISPSSNCYSFLSSETEHDDASNSKESSRTNFNAETMAGRISMLKRLQPILLDLWVECSGEYGINGSKSSSQYLSMLYLIKLTNILWKWCLDSSDYQKAANGIDLKFVHGSLKKYRKHVLDKYFPLKYSKDSSFMELNLTMSNFVTNILMAYLAVQPDNYPEDEDLAKLYLLCISYVQEEIERHLKKSSHSFRPENIDSLLYTVENLLYLKQLGTASQTGKLFMDLMQINEKAALGSKIRRKTSKFILSVVEYSLLYNDDNPDFFIINSSGNLPDFVENWLSDFPKEIESQITSNSYEAESYLRFLIKFWNFWPGFPARITKETWSKILRELSNLAHEITNDSSTIKNFRNKEFIRLLSDCITLMSSK